MADTTIYIVSTLPLDNRYNHTYYFENKAAQAAFFQSKVVKTFTNYTYIRRTWKLKVAATYEEAERWGYLFFTNRTGGKTYYYFITNVEYLNDATVELTLEMDVLQTYMFDYALRPCFIERQHSSTDAIGENTIDEGLELGELITAHDWDVEGLQDMCIIILAAADISAEMATSYDVCGGERFDNMFSGVGVFYVDLAKWKTFGELLAHFSSVDGVVDSIMAMYMYPKNLITLDDTLSTQTIRTVKDSTSMEVTLAPYTNYSTKLFGGYTPKNNKLYCYPYNHLYLTNNAGASAEYKYERMRLTTIDGGEDAYVFNLWGGLSADAGVRIVPEWYNDVGGYEYGVHLGNFPQCAWNSDTYKVWLSQNIHTLNQQQTVATGSAALGALMMVGGVAAMATGVGAGVGMGAVSAGAGMLGSGLMKTQQMVAQRKDMESQPPQARGVHSATINTNAMKQTFTFSYKTVSAEYAKIIDDFFTMYGYKVNQIAVPNRNARKCYTYVKTVDCTIEGAMPDSDKRLICSIYDKGVTWWKPEYKHTIDGKEYTFTVNMCDYGISNPPNNAQ